MLCVKAHLAVLSVGAGKGRREVVFRADSATQADRYSNL
jgi:hypothetical protein